MAWTSPRTWVSGELITASIMNTYIRDNQNVLKTPINDSGEVEFTDATQLPIASGVITVTQNYHKVDTQSDAATDDLDTITAGTNVAAGFILHLRVESDARTVVLKNGTSGSDNLDIGSDVTLDESYKTYSLVYDGTNWRPLTFAESPTFASISPLTTRGDTLVATSGTVTGTRLAIGAANTYLKSDATDATWGAGPTFAEQSPLTTRGDTLVSTSGTVTGTRLAVGGWGTNLVSDGTDVAWGAGYRDLSVTLADVSNTTAKTTCVTTEVIPADMWTIGSVLEIDISAAMVNNSGSTRTTNFEFNFGDGSQTQNKDWENGSTVRYQWWRIYVMRKDSDELIIPFSGPAYYYAGWNPGQGSQLRMTVNNFDSASAFTIALTFATASASYYCSPQAGQARFYKKE